MPNMQAIYAIILKYGLPMGFYTDGAAWFKVTRHWEGSTLRQAKSDTEYCTQIERALDELGIELIIAGSPQAKGRVERTNGTLQDRLIAELALKNIKTLNDANWFIEDFFIEDYNRRFSKAPLLQDQSFLPFLRKDKLTQMLCVRLNSQVQNDNTVSKSGRYKLQLLPTATRLSWAKAPVEVSLLLNGKTEVRHATTKELIPHEVLSLELPREFKYPVIAQNEPDIFIWSK
jgi:hypothetical protein